MSQRRPIAVRVAPPAAPGSMNGTTTIRRRPRSSTASWMRAASTWSSSANGVRSTVWFGNRRMKRRIAASSCAPSIGASAADGTVATAAACSASGWTVASGSPASTGLVLRLMITGDRIASMGSAPCGRTLRCRDRSRSVRHPRRGAHRHARGDRARISAAGEAAPPRRDGAAHPDHGPHQRGVARPLRPSAAVGMGWRPPAGRSAPTLAVGSGPGRPASGGARRRAADGARLGLARLRGRGGGRRWGSRR